MTLTNARIRWTSKENETLAKTVLSAKSNGETFTKAYSDAAKILMIRTPEACETQWRKIKHLYKKELTTSLASKLTPVQITKKAAQAATVKTTQTKLEALINSINVANKEGLKVLDSGKGGIEFVVINNEGEAGYLVTTENNKVTSCNCPNHQFRQVVCKHMIKVALNKKLEVF